MKSKISKIIFGPFIVAFALSLISPNALANQYFFPTDNHIQRETLKSFGQLIDTEYYNGKDNFFPFHRPTGYHAAVDLETFGNEAGDKVPVYTVGSGQISYIGSIDGYGGLILQKLNGENTTALYGHVKIEDLDLKIGDLVSGGQLLTYLGDAFTSETARTRKHLHFGIYKGQHLYFRGYEKSQDDISKNWENPITYLENKGAISPISKDQSSNNDQSSSELNNQSIENRQGILYALANYLNNLLRLFGLNFNE